MISFAVELGVHRVGGMPRATADFVEAEIARDRENPGREFRRHFVTVRGFKDLQEYMLGQVFGFGGVAKRPVNEVHYRLFVLIDQRLKSIAITLTHTQHEGGIDVDMVGHYIQQSTKHWLSAKVSSRLRTAHPWPYLSLTKTAPLGDCPATSITLIYGQRNFAAGLSKRTRTFSEK